MVTRPPLSGVTVTEESTRVTVGGLSAAATAAAALVDAAARAATAARGVGAAARPGLAPAASHVAGTTTTTSATASSPASTRTQRPIPASSRRRANGTYLAHRTGSERQSPVWNRATRQDREEYVTSP